MTDTRHAMARAFADAQGWAHAELQIVAGDASNRKYYRLAHQDESVIVMDAPPDKGEDTAPFINIATYLEGAGLSAPRILDADTDNGFLMIEDFGDDLFARLLTPGEADETTLYEAATDVLVHLHRQSPPKLARYDAVIMADMAQLATVWYAAHADTSAPQTSTLRDAMYDHLSLLDKTQQVLIQRDYHAENLIWLPDRVSVRRVGLLDFQDAMLGHPAYDLVSILQDARRDVPHELGQTMLTRYITATGCDAADFTTAYHLLGLQRNLRILGVFARLCSRDGKPHYVDLIPRVWGHVQTNLNALKKQALTDAVAQTLPPPTPEILNALASKCPTTPAPQ